MVGREEEHAAVLRVVDQLNAGRPRIVVVGGEAGVGKTRLIDETMDAVGDRVRVLRGSCLALGGALPYMPFAEMIRGLLRELDAADIERLVGPVGHELARFMPEITTVVRPDSPPVSVGGSDLERLRLFEALLRLAEGVALDRSTVFVFEDVQWIDGASLQLLSFLSHNMRQGQALLIITVRTEALEAAGPVLSFLAELERDRDVMRVELERLDQEATRRQLSAILDERVPEATVERICRLGDGNPLFTEELLAAVDLGSDGVTPRLRDLLGARSARLPADAQEMLAIAATVGRSIDTEILAAASGLDEAQVRHAVRAGIDEQVLIRARDGRGYRFRHELMRAAIAAELTDAEAERIHAAYAQTLLERDEDADPAEVAHHLDAAADVERALPWHVRAGRDAELRFAYTAAQQHYERALEVWPTVSDAPDTAGMPRDRLLQRAATCAARAGAHERALELARTFLAEAGDRVDDLVELVRSSTRWYLWESGRTDEALAESRAAVSRTDEGIPPRWRANALGHLAGLLLVDDQIPEARTRAEEALVLATAAEALEEQALANGVIGGCQLLLGETDEGIARIGDVLEAARRMEQEDTELSADQLDDRRHPVGVVLTATQLAAAYETADRNEEAVRIAAEGYDAARSRGVARTYGAALRAAGARGLYRLGRWDEALESIGDALRSGAAGAGRVGLLAIAALIHVARDDDREAEAALRAADDDAGLVTATEALRWLAAARAESLIWDGRPLEAAGVIAMAYEAGQAGTRGAGLGQAVGLDASLPQLLSQAARAAADLALQERAGLVAAPISEQATERVRAGMRRARRRPGLALAWATDLAITSAELARAEQSAGTRGVNRWRVAAEAAAERPYAEAYARWRLASALLGDRRRSGEAAAEIERASELADAIGAARLSSAIGTLADRAGLRRDGTASATERPFGLTERELEVLGLLAAGLANAEIAEELFISPKTASVHVSNIYGKLGVESRVAAATVAHEVGLVAPRTSTEDTPAD